MRTKNIQITQAQTGMRVANDVYTDKDDLIIAKDSVLSSSIIKRLVQYGIYRLEVYEESCPSPNNKTTSASTKKAKSVQAIRNTKEFQEFQKDFDSAVVQLKKTFFNIADKTVPVQKADLLHEVDTLLKRGKNQRHLLEMIHSMREYDDVTFAHCISVALLCNIMGEWMGYVKSEIEVLTLCGLLHDVGKLMIPSELITKPGRLTPNEYEIVKHHPEFGYNILRTQKIDNRIKFAALMHHERCDGSGYPKSTKVKQIEIFTKIVAIADVYDAMTADRSYRKGLCPFYVLRMFEEDALTKYDTKILYVFMKKIAESYLNAQVELNNGQQGEIVQINEHAFSSPLVKVNNQIIDLSKNRKLEIQKIL